MRKAILTLGAGLVAAAAGILPVVSATAASAAPAPHLTGSVNIDNPDLYSGFNNIGGTPTASTGSLTYTNFNYADPGSGVWSLHKGTPIHFNVAVGNANFNHVLIVDSIEPSGPNALTFTGHGHWADLNGPDGPIVNWTATGTVSGGQMVLHLTYTTGPAGYVGYTATDTFTIAPDGGGSGTSSDAAVTGITLDPGSLFEALAFNAPVSNVSFPNGTDAQFSSVVPAGHALAGTPFTVKVHDGGNPGVGHDTWSQDGTSYTVDGGNLTVH
jgi:hypothetical protein